MKTKRYLPLAAAAAIAAAIACSQGGVAHVSVRLTDAPGDLESAVVTITRITLQGPGGETVLSDVERTVDLLALANEATSLVEDVPVEPGRYEQLRFHISGGYVEVQDPDGEGTLVYASSPDYVGLERLPEGTPIAGLLKMPSYAQSGLKVTLPGEALVLAAESKILLVDFDVSQSFGHDAGDSDSWVMHPVIRGADFRLSGNVVATLALAPGVTLPVLNGAPVTLAQFEAVLRNAEGTSEEKLPFTSLGDGRFAARFQYLLPGDYTLEVAGPAGVSFAILPPGSVPVTVVGGADAVVDFVITSAAAP